MGLIRILFMTGKMFHQAEELCRCLGFYSLPALYPMRLSNMPPSITWKGVILFVILGDFWQQNDRCDYVCRLAVTLNLNGGDD